MGPCEYHTKTIEELVKTLTKLSEENDRLEIEFNDKLSILEKRIEQLEQHLPKEHL